MRPGHVQVLIKWNRLPPWLCRLLAKERAGRGRWRLLSLDELARRTGFSKTKVIRISKLPRWDTVAVGDALTFARACGQDLCHHKRVPGQLRDTRHVAWKEDPERVRIWLKAGGLVV